MLKVRDATNTPRSISDIKIRNVANVLTDISFLRVRDAGGVLRTIWQRLGVSLASYVEGYGASNSPVSIVTSAPNPSVYGGRAPFTYAWTGGGGGWSILYPTQLNTAFRRTSVANGANYTETFDLTVTDADGNTANASVTAYVENIGTA